MLLLTCLHLLFPRITLVWADTHYQGIKTWARENLGLKSSSTGGPVSVLSAGQEPPSRPSGFHVLPHRWVIERTFAWISRNRRLAKDYENLPESGEAFIYMAMSRILLKRLARDSSISDISKA
jgi:transposase